MKKRNTKNNQHIPSGEEEKRAKENKNYKGKQINSRKK